VPISTEQTAATAAANRNTRLENNVFGVDVIFPPPLMITKFLSPDG